MFVAVRDQCVVDDVGARFENLGVGMKTLGIKDFEMLLTPTLTATFAGRAPAKPVDLSTKRARQDFVDDLDSRGLSPCCILITNNFAKPLMEREVEYVVNASQVAADIGVKVINVYSIEGIQPGLEGYLPPKDIYKYLGRAVKGFKECLKAIEGLGVYLAIETHGSFGGRMGTLHRVLREVNSDLLGVALHCNHFYIQGYSLNTVYDIVYSLAPYVKHTHIMNTKLPENEKDLGQLRVRKEHQWIPLDEGDINHKVLVEILKEAGYKGPLCIEEFFKQPAIEERQAILRKEASYLKKII